MNVVISAADMAVILLDYRDQVTSGDDRVGWCLAQVAAYADGELNGLRTLSPRRAATLRRFVRLYEQLRAAMGPLAVVLELRMDAGCAIQTGPTMRDVVRVDRVFDGYTCGDGMFYTLDGLIERLAMKG